MRDGPLTGTRVLDLTNVLAGPYCSYQLALLGAEVIKVEAPGSGDLARQLGADAELNAVGLGTSFLAQNAGKKSVVVDLKSDDGRAAFTTLVEGADVLVENFRPGVLTKLGFSWTELREINPGLVYCAISGFGQTGPMSQRPAYDQIIQGLSGMMSITGTRDTAPLRVGFPICDTIGGLTAAMAINAALTGRARTGEGSFIDVSMLEASLSAMGWAVSNYLISGLLTEPMGDQNATAAPSGTFGAADGPLNIAANKQEQFVTLCRIIDRLDLIDDERFREREARKVNREALNREINAALRARPALEWEEELSSAGVPAARVLTVEQALDLEQLADRGFIAELPMPDGMHRTLRVVGNGAMVDGQPSVPVLPPPLLGEHNQQLLPDGGDRTDHADSAAAS
ncbi:CaiB/BaiF CoA transferase family protein [Jiangella anatolica]|uniref:CoA transferase n=1 Tax=Jiangella anatolica TaxID=2670374 RepID=A0A2W2CZF4_9ACTN|nr:CoA transferase [Jiangella anatolica]PZF85623.1 CoA transferase [Jiangella anatolica]